MVSCKEYVAIEKENLKRRVEQSHPPRLDIFQYGDNPASDSYVRGKMRDCAEIGIECELHKSTATTTKAVIDQVNEVANCTDGVIIQLPVPEGIDTDLVVNKCLTSRTDVDGFVYDRHLACTPRGIIDWLKFNNVSLDGKNVVIIGRSDIVGKPLAKVMTDLNATVTLCHSHTDEESLYRHCSMADIIVVAVGKPRWFKAYRVSNCPLIIDVGINRDENNRLCGDVDQDGYEGYLTPVPGGVGLLTRVALLKNVMDSAQDMHY